MICSVFWLVGFGFFLHPPDLSSSKDHTDAIVVWTGGTGRIEEGVNCLHKDLAKVLFISGVHEDVVLKDLIDAPHMQGRVFLGHEAKTTQENALETKLWLKKNGIHSVRLITAHYHMRRSLLELESLVPSLRIIPHVIRPASFAGEWWHDKNLLRLALTEYNKFLYAYGRLAFESFL
jgi:uncharacterized SAM-binding protein YcdF (DUF218 family)